jgi:predicted glycoside hydrolase/deacetylase ChbG (UPF0249 family)
MAHTLAGGSKGYSLSPKLWHASSHSVVCEFPRLAPSAHDLMEGIEGAVRRSKQDLQAAQNCMAQREIVGS